ncbi:MAG: phosphoenolpyruvate--protein phosphotransferase [Chloroflexota bacterium]
MTEINLQGVGASAGVVLAPAFFYEPLKLEIPVHPAADTEAEMQRFDTARAAARAELDALQTRVAERAGAEEAEIFAAHAMLVDDPTLADAVRQGVSSGQNIEAAVDAATRQIAAMFREMGDDLFAARADDIMDVGRRLLRILLDVPDRSLDAIEIPCVLVTSELTPSDTATLDTERVLGLAVAHGGVTSHAAILARTLGIPAVVALGDEAINQVKSGMMLALDGATGDVIINPSNSTQSGYRQRQAKLAARAQKINSVVNQDCHTADGRRVEIQANIGNVESARDAVSKGAEGVGLLRTEFLYLDRATPPDEDEQITLYRDIFTAMGGRPVVVRTLDLGGDKPPSFMDFPQEDNPFLGWRGARLYMEEQALFKTQMRAILRAAVGYQVQVMFPMIESVETLRAVMLLVQAVREELTAKGILYAEDVPLGIMVETPSAALSADLLAEDAAFFSIGSNDLTQYTLAADRDNPRVASFFQPMNPALLRLVGQAITAAHAAGRKISMCGELAGMPLAIPILLGLGLDKFSMVPAAIAEAKWIISHLTTADAQTLAQEALRQPTAVAVQAYMTEALRQRDLI